MADLVRVRNLDSKSLRIAYNSQPTVIGAGQDGFVDREAACAHFGVWWSVKGGRPIDRTEEYGRVRGLYGSFPGAPQDANTPSWEDVKPKVEIYELDGTKVSTVIEDPEGEAIPVTERQDEGHMRATVEKMREQLEEMQRKLDTSETIVAAHTAPELPAEDSPDTAPRRKRQPGKIEAARLDEAAS